VVTVGHVTDVGMHRPTTMRIPVPTVRMIVIRRMTRWKSRMTAVEKTIPTMKTKERKVTGLADITEYRLEKFTINGKCECLRV
jgi:hypothetical protein